MIDLRAALLALSIGCTATVSAAAPTGDDAPVVTDDAATRREALPPLGEASPGEPAVSAAPRWYGGQLLVVDGAIVTLAAVGALLDRDDPSAPVVLGLLGYLVAGPIVHWVHGNVRLGFGSLAARLGGPIIGVVVGLVGGFALGDANVGMAVGATLGGLTIIALDAAKLAWDTPEPALAVAPILLPRREGGLVGGVQLRF